MRRVIDTQPSELHALRKASFRASAYSGEVTLVAYSFPPPEREGEMFSRLEFAILHSWQILGKLKTALVVNRPFHEASRFAATHTDVVELQVAPGLVPGNIKTMSLDCIKNLHGRFSTPYCLVIQDDGVPLRDTLRDFLGKYDFIGAPIISDGWRRKLAYAIGLGSFNGGFSLRSRRFCEYASHMWFSFFSKFMREDSRHLGEDFYYTTLLKLLPMTWWRFHFPGEGEAFRFSVDRLGGRVSPPKGVRPFGIHGKMPGVTVLAYHFWEKSGYEDAFAKIRHAFEETWRHCGRLKSVLVVNGIAPCVERFVAENENVEVQVEPSLVPGKIFTMSADMNGRLWKRFQTPFVLIVQSDGFPLRPGLDDFIGKYDFIGAPYIRNTWWKQLVARVLNCHVQNGGFSLRSRAVCEAAAHFWNSKYAALGEFADSSEDLFYTKFLPLHERSYRRRFRLGHYKESLLFSYDAIVPVETPAALPFGFHGEEAFNKLCSEIP